MHEIMASEEEPVEEVLLVQNEESSDDLSTDEEEAVEGEVEAFVQRMESEGDAVVDALKEHFTMDKEAEEAILAEVSSAATGVVGDIENSIKYCTATLKSLWAKMETIPSISDLENKLLSVVFEFEKKVCLFHQLF